MKQQQKKGGFDFFGLFKSDKQDTTVNTDAVPATNTAAPAPATVEQQKMVESQKPTNSLWGGKSKRRRNKKGGSKKQKKSNKSKKQ